MRMTVATEEVLEPEHVAVAGAPDDHGTAAAGLDQPDATQDQGAHDALAEVGLGDQQARAADRCGMMSACTAPLA